MKIFDGYQNDANLVTLTQKKKPDRANPKTDIAISDL